LRGFGGEARSEKMTSNHNGSALFKKTERLLSRAAALVERMDASDSAEEITQSWESFVGIWVKARRFALHAANISKLTEVSTAIEDSCADAVLEYVFQARNADEHNAELIAETEPGYILRAPPSFPRVIFNNTTNNISLQIPTEQGYGTYHIRSGGIVDHEGAGPAAKIESVNLLRLVPVESRGVQYAVPKSQFGKDMYAQEVAKYCVDWLQSQLNKR
jgi:hypothetical protein